MMLETVAQAVATIAGAAAAGWALYRRLEKALQNEVGARTETDGASLRDVVLRVEGKIDAHAERVESLSTRVHALDSRVKKLESKKGAHLRAAGSQKP